MVCILQYALIWLDGIYFCYHLDLSTFHTYNYVVFASLNNQAHDRNIINFPLSVNQQATAARGLRDWSSITGRGDYKIVEGAGK